MEIMHTMANEAITQRPKRRYYNPELKTQVVAQCQVSGASVAGVALAHGINADIVHRWLREQLAQCKPAVGNEFVALPLTRASQPQTAPASELAGLPRDIRVSSTSFYLVEIDVHIFYAETDSKEQIWRLIAPTTRACRMTFRSR
ncbi:hypothetical protein [Acidovorax carolinensis]|uniref:hypothetical protein n=1 Tax=Acidovorax carolinensis TaxID=553814 RepID=UPI000B346C95|nr:hypothetical protein [Acidovorax carolinensis]ART49567.1 hypothetical protein CBP33_16775 [Acidovorax carolinensis]